MSAISATPTTAAAVRRPGMLVATISIVVVTALAAIVNGIITATGGKEVIKQAFENAGYGSLSDSDIETMAQLAGYSSTDDMLSSFTMRGYLVAGCGVLLLLFGILMRKAATFARVMVTISAVLVMVFSLLILGDETTGTMAGLSMLAMLGGVLSIIFTWLPPNGRYGKAVRAAG